MNKSKIGHIRTSIAEERRHRNAVKRKRARIAGLETLLEMWEGNGSDPEYVKSLHTRYRHAKNQLKAMRGSNL